MNPHKIGDLFLSHSGTLLGVVIGNGVMKEDGEVAYKVQWLDDVNSGYINAHAIGKLKLNLKRYMDGQS